MRAIIKFFLSPIYKYLINKYDTEKMPEKQQELRQRAVGYISNAGNIRLQLPDIKLNANNYLEYIKANKPEQLVPRGNIQKDLVYILKALININKEQNHHLLTDYISSVAELLMRRLEIKKQEAVFINTQGRADRVYLLLEYTRVMQLLAEGYSDARYFNTSLKLLDWSYNSLNKLKPDNSPVLIESYSLYIECYDKQERLFAHFQKELML